jgi:hypothetical protein
VAHRLCPPASACFERGSLAMFEVAGSLWYRVCLAPRSWDSAIGYRCPLGSAASSRTVGHRRFPARLQAAWTSWPEGDSRFHASSSSCKSSILRSDPTHDARRPREVSPGCSSCSPTDGGDRCGCGTEAGARLVHGLRGTKHNRGLLQRVLDRIFSIPPPSSIFINDFKDG